jgi:hypothetical protein
MRSETASVRDSMITGNIRLRGRVVDKRKTIVIQTKTNDAHL